MKNPRNKVSKVSESVKADADRLADFVLFTQRSCILNLSNELNKGNISFPQFFLLTYLSSEEYLTMSDIATKMGHSTAAATGLVDRLEKHGYVQRICAADDRRKIMACITAKGLELVSRMREEISADLGKILSGMQEEEECYIENGEAVIKGSDGFTFFLDPGSATKNVVREVFESISDFNIACGGEGVEFGANGNFVFASIKPKALAV
jgi:DNA-binding MarR family transcriptional regulator